MLITGKWGLYDGLNLIGRYNGFVVGMCSIWPTWRRKTVSKSKIGIKCGHWGCVVSAHSSVHPFCTCGSTSCKGYYPITIYRAPSKKSWLANLLPPLLSTPLSLQSIPSSKVCYLFLLQGRSRWTPCILGLWTDGGMRFLQGKVQIKPSKKSRMTCGQHGRVELCIGPFLILLHSVMFLSTCRFNPLNSAACLNSFKHPSILNFESLILIVLNVNDEFMIFEIRCRVLTRFPRRLITYVYTFL